MNKNKQSIVSQLHSKGLINPQPFIIGGIQYEVVMGSVCYCVSNDNSDMDIYGFCMPPKDYIFPHLSGYIHGFGQGPQGFDQYQQHHIKDESVGKEYDLYISGIIKYVHLLMQNNPNIIDSLFVPENMILTSTKIANMIRDERKSFLHKGSWHRFKGYAFQQLKKCKIKTPKEGSKRWESVQKYGFDVKFAYHIVRLINECEQILVHHDLDLQEKSSREQMKAIRRGDWTLEQIEEYFLEKSKDLEKLYHSSKLPYAPDEVRVKNLLLNCLEEYYGNLSNCIVRPDKAMIAIDQIKEIIYKNNL